MSATQHLCPLSIFANGSLPGLDEFCSDRPIGWETSRNPTVRELRQVIDSLEGYEVWDNLDDGEPLWVGSPAEGVSIFVEEYLPERNQDKPHEIYFDGTDTLEVKIVEKLAHTCGPLLLADAQYIIVEAGTSADAPWLYWPNNQRS